MIDSAVLSDGEIRIFPANLAPLPPKGGGDHNRIGGFFLRYAADAPGCRKRVSFFLRALISHFLICLAQINIDYNTRVAIQRGVATPTKACFEAAQQQVYNLMKKDSYPRFLLSDTYRRLAGKQGPGAGMFRRRSRSCVFDDRGEAAPERSAW